jgi:hypothetical protein
MAFESLENQILYLISFGLLAQTLQTSLIVLLDYDCHGRMARGGHRLPKVSPGLAMPYPSMPCGRDTPETPAGTPHAARL